MRFFGRRDDDERDRELERETAGKTPFRGAKFDFDQIPAAAVALTADGPTAFAAGEITAEFMALVNCGAMTSHNADSGLPSCVGPVVIHEDGVTECYGCSDPMLRVHPPGSTWSCGPGREFGIGHLCPRCSPEGQAEAFAPRRIFKVNLDGEDMIVSEEWAAVLAEAGTEPIVEVTDPPPTDDVFATAVGGLQREVMGMWGPLRGSGNGWKCVVVVGEDVDRRVQVKLMGGAEGARVEAWTDVDVPRSARREMGLFCVAANRLFAKWNLYLAPAADVGSDAPAAVDRVIATDQALSFDDNVIIEAPMIVAAFFAALEAAVLSAPAIEAILNGASALEAVEIADKYGDSFFYKQ